MEHSTLFPAEWYPQSAVQLTWPHENTDWAPLLDEVIPCFVSIAKEILKREKLILVCQNREVVLQQLGEGIDESRILFCEIDSNDTWARDHGGISVFENGDPVVYDFTFNGWGLKYPANQDNMITQYLFAYDLFNENVTIANLRYLVLEGGSLETDGKGTLLTTEECLLSMNRNDFLTKDQIEEHLKHMFGLERVLWLTSGYLEGDDTDSHIDTLARFCSEDTIAYVQCQDKDDDHFEELQLMEQELKMFRQMNGEPYQLIPLPMADKVEWEGERLPATYANFLIINGAVLLPFYDSPKDQVAKAALQYAFPDREIIGINCLPLIKQHGSLHCVTMQYPGGFVN
ncbi:agmatine deiminase family protein [Parabacteroides sp. 52]|uniref:agmatine deiminase family protein n=1 Tax=unclassified Parabacteroides TaxID=2649774 RepID=UPI0013D17FC6|nr:MULTISPECIES: agmatine deiminase family protein [unclassified Parabacteroides]NDV54770.1 agmatine deiminase family protein [Parabacteroides sp. 52]